MLKKTVISFMTLVTTIFGVIPQAQAAYTMGPYVSIGAGAANFNTNFLGIPISSTFGEGSLGVGYLWPLNSQSEDPFFIGIEGNGNVYANNTVFYGAELNLILGKQLSPTIGVYGKLGALGIGKMENGSLSGTGGGQTGVGIGFQVMPNLRVTAEATGGLVGISTQVKGMVGLQYSFG